MATKSPTIFDELASGAYRQSYVPRTLEAQQYYRRKAASLQNLTPGRLIRQADPDRVSGAMPQNNSIIGSMAMFHYSPKHKDTLPYYDRNPLVFILKPLPNGFLGLNFHYLPYKWRAILLNRLSSLATDRDFDESTTLRLSYEFLNASSRYAPFKPCVKRYLNTHVRSRFLWIPANEWEIAIFLPVQKFVGASTSKVWADSKKYY